MRCQVYVAVDAKLGKRNLFNLLLVNTNFPISWKKSLRVPPALLQPMDLFIKRVSNEKCSKMYILSAKRSLVKVHIISCPHIIILSGTSSTVVKTFEGGYRNRFSINHPFHKDLEQQVTISLLFA